MKISKSNPKEHTSNPVTLTVESAKRLFATNKGWGILLLILGIFSMSSARDSSSQNSSSGSFAAVNEATGNTLALIIFVASVIGLMLILLIALALYLQGMLSYVALESEKGNKVSPKQAVNAVNKKFWELLGSNLLAMVKIFGGLLLFVVPGIILLLKYSLLSYVIMDQPEEKSAKENHARTREITNGRLWEVAGVSCMGIVPIIGTLLDTAGKAAQYNQLRYYTDKNLEKPQPIHWLNYAFPVLLLAIIFAALIAALTIIAVADL